MCCDTLTHVLGARVDARIMIMMGARINTHSSVQQPPTHSSGNGFLLPMMLRETIYIRAEEISQITGQSITRGRRRRVVCDDAQGDEDILFPGSLCLLALNCWCLFRHKSSLKWKLARAISPISSQSINANI